MPAQRRSRYVPARGLDEAVARRVAAPAVEAVTAEVEAEARLNMPGAKKWVSMRDDHVRPSHVRADGQVVPDPLRFKVGRDLLRTPRDPAGAPEETAGCRCEPQSMPDAVRRAVNAEPVVVLGTRVTGKVAVEFNRIHEVEFGTAEEPALRPMGNAARTVASRHRRG